MYLTHTRVPESLRNLINRKHTKFYIEAVPIFFSTPKKNIFLRSKKKSKMLFCLLPLVKYIKNTKPDLIICSQFYANIIVLLACLISSYKNKIILCERVPVFENLKKISILKRSVIKFLIKTLYKKADKIVCNSYGTKNDLSKITDVKNSVSESF